MIKTTQIDGDVAVDRHTSIGGDVIIQGNGHIKKNLRVDGILTANKIKGPEKGVFSSIEELKSAFPNPSPGDWALVTIQGSVSPEYLGQLFLAEDGEWVGKFDENDFPILTGTSHQNSGSGGSGSGVYVITSTSKTPPSDYNVYSALRSDKQFLSKNKADTARGHITFEEGASFGSDAHIDKAGNAELLTAVVHQLLRSARFVDGVGGEGWKLWIDENELSNLTIDKLTVRQVMTVFELLIDKVRSVGGQIVVSAANGKIKTVAESGDAYVIEFEQENTFQVHDLIRCQTFTGGNLKSYWVEIAAVEGNKVLVNKSEFSSSSPAVGDECVLAGNTENKLRQNLILISATEEGRPRMDVMDGVKGKSFTDCLRARLGNLDGINDSAFPLDNQPQGNGLYADNAYLRGTFLLSTGEDIKTKFQVTEGLIKSSAEAIRQDFVADKGFLNNPSFGDGLEKWLTENETTFWLVGNKWIWANNNVLTKKGDGANVLKDDGRVVVRILNKYITQKNHNLRGIPTMRVGADGLKEPLPVYLSFLYKCKKGGNLNIKFNNVDKAGFEDFDSFDVSEELSPTDGYQQYTCSGLWNGTGDFCLSFTGEIYLYMLVLSTDKIESLTYKYRTLFEQSEKLVQIAAQNFDKDGNVLESSGIVTTSNFAGIFASAVDNDTDIVKKADISTFITKDENGNIESGVHIGADNISLEGIVTANENFKIKEDGSIEAKNANLSGDLLSSNKRLGHSISVNASNGSLSLSGPVSVMYEDGEHLPSNTERQDLWKVAFEVDHDTNTSVASMYLYGMHQMVNIDPIFGISLIPRDITNNNGCFINKDEITIIGDRGTCHITSSGIVFRNSNGDIIKQI